MYNKDHSKASVQSRESHEVTDLPEEHNPDVISEEPGRVYISECAYDKSVAIQEKSCTLPTVFCPSYAKASLQPSYVSNQKESLGFGVCFSNTKYVFSLMHTSNALAGAEQLFCVLFVFYSFFSWSFSSRDISFAGVKTEAVPVSRVFPVCMQCCRR